MAIRFYNTASRKKEDFVSLREGKVGMYVCGVTVYDLCHIGHARSAIVFDVLARYLRARGYDVTYVRNFTDVDDKIIQRAKELGKDSKELAEEYIEAFYEDMGRLGVLNADKEPRATEHVDDMIEMIKTLIDKGYAYVQGGDVYYSVETFKEYGRLSGRRLEDMKAGSRVAVDDKKRHPMDFALWKAAKPEEPRWPSPWGPGRPGWHMECSVMSNHFLGATFDIHGGGKDLLFPHHENERAQSIAANGGEFARYWIHNGFVTVESEKMSKSLGNFLTVRDALEMYHPEVLRLFLLSKHYRSPIDFSKEHVLDLQSGLVRIYRTIQRIRSIAGTGSEPGSLPSAPPLQSEPPPGFLEDFVGMMDDDLNTAGAIGLLFEKVKEMNRLMDERGASIPQADRERLGEGLEQLLLAGSILGILAEDPDDFFKELSGQREEMDPEWIGRLIEERSRARAHKDWARADEIRDRLRNMGVVLEDGPEGTTWRLDV
ncbi:MAG: cysteine--tRNA ligase [Deltaproteobacteria bacterium]|nr:cysteine--tRNA ligase [Deltaproteobacteria bacterium]MBW2137405.1 cysteine--tRNA ligase [Deltaproteobacteria bacterium]